MDIKAMTEVYFNESNRRRNESGMQTSLQRMVSKIIWSSPALYSHERCYPKMSVHQERSCFGFLSESSYDTGHQVANDDQVAHSHAETFDRNGCIEYDRGIGIGDLR